MKGYIKIKENERKSQVNSPKECFLPRSEFFRDLRAGIFSNSIRGEGEGSVFASFPFFINLKFNAKVDN